MKAGYSRANFNQSPPFPLAGLVTIRPRMAENIRDPLGVTAVVLAGRNATVALISADLLIITPELLDAVREICKEHGITGLYITASHTHSGPGGWVKRKGAKPFMGPFDPGMFNTILNGFQAAIRGAVADITPVESMHWGIADVPGLTMNRRLREGPTDDRVVRIGLSRRNAADVVIWSASGHPVATAFIQTHTASADVPGQVCKTLKNTGVLPIFMPGAMGGLNLLFPEEEPRLETHLALITKLVSDGLDRARAAAHSVDHPEMDFHTATVHFDRQAPPMVVWPPKQAIQSLLWSAAGTWFRVKTADSHVFAEIPVLQMGPAMLAGMPADFGVGATLKIRNELEKQGVKPVIITSHTNGFIGYVHLSREMAWDDRAKPGVFHYENAMAWYGRNAGDELVRVVTGLKSVYSDV